MAARVVGGRVFYIDRILGVGETGPFIPQASETVTRIEEDEW